MGLVGLLLLSSLFDTSAAALNQEALASYQGGVLKYCIGTLPDAGPHCNTCTSDGNNGFVRCSSSFLDMKWQYIPFQNPRQVWDETEENCGEDLEHFTMAGCPGSPTSVDTDGCLRQYTALTFQYYDGGNCP
jgi:hypothetical protein